MLPGHVSGWEAGVICVRPVPRCAQLMETKIPFLEIEQLKVKAEEAKTKVAEIVRQIQVRS